MGLSVSAFGLGAVRQAARARHLHRPPAPAGEDLAAAVSPADAAPAARRPRRALSRLAGAVLVAALGVGVAGGDGAAGGRCDPGA